MITGKNLNKSFFGEPVLQDVSFTINQGVKLPILILTNSTDSSFSWKARLDSPKARQDGTIVGTVLALDCSVF